MAGFITRPTSAPAQGRSSVLILDRASGEHKSKRCGRTTWEARYLQQQRGGQDARETQRQGPTRRREADGQQDEREATHYQKKGYRGDVGDFINPRQLKRLGQTHRPYPFKQLS